MDGATDIWTDRQTDKHTDRRVDGQTDEETDTPAKREVVKETVRLTDITKKWQSLSDRQKDTNTHTHTENRKQEFRNFGQADVWTDGHGYTVGCTNVQTDGWTNRQTNRQTDQLEGLFILVYIQRVDLKKAFLLFFNDSFLVDHDSYFANFHYGYSRNFLRLSYDQNETTVAA